MRWISLWVFAATSALSAQSPARSIDDTAAIQKSEAFFQDTMRVLGIPGAQVCVARADRIAWSEAFGLADVEHQIPATSTTRFRIGSISKSLTATGVALLVQDGKLDIDTPIQRYVPSFPLKPWPISTRQLAGHLAGIRHYAPGEFESRVHYRTTLEGLRIFAADSLLFQPGTAFSYSSYGYNLIGAIIEGSSGQPYLEFMRTRVFVPSGMMSTEPDFADSAMPSRSHFYVHPDSTRRTLEAPFVDNSYKWASGGFLSTADDLCRFGQTLLDGRLMRPDLLQLLWTSQQTGAGQPTGYGIGWYVTRDKAGRRIVFHTGGAEGSSALLAVYPSDSLVMAILLNSERTFIEQAGRVANWFLEE